MPKQDIHEQFQQWTQEYGPVYSLMLGTRATIVLSSDQAVKDLLDKRSAIYSNRPPSDIGQTLMSKGNRMLLTSYGPTLSMIRKMVHRFLREQQSGAYIPYQDLENKQMLYELLTQAEHLLDSLRRYATSLTTSLEFGWRTASLDDHRMVQLFHRINPFTKWMQDVDAALLDV